MLDDADPDDIMELCLTCNRYVKAWLESKLAAQHENYVFSYMAMRRLLGRDLAGIIGQHYFIVEMSEIVW
jgi:hypothetical protein